MKYLEFMGPIIRYHRLEKGIDVGTICIQTGIQKPQYVAIEEGKREVLLNTWKRICDAVELDFVYLFKNLEVYDDLYDLCLHALLYDDIEEQRILKEQIRNEAIKKSIMLPKFLLLKFIYQVMNEGKQSTTAIVELLEQFQGAFSCEEKCLYYDYQGYHEQILQHYEEAMVFYKKAEHMPTLEHKDILHYHIGMLYYKLNSPVTALYYLQEAYTMFEKKWNVNRLLYTHGSIGICYTRMSEFELAERQLKETVHLAQQYKNQYVVRTTYDNLSFNSFKKRDYDACISYTEKAIHLGSDYSFLYFYLAYSYTKLNNTAKALEWIEKGKEAKIEKHASALLKYVKLMLQNEDYVTYLDELYTYLVKADLYELQKLILLDLADLFHSRGEFEQESRCLRELLLIDKTSKNDKKEA